MFIIQEKMKRLRREFTTEKKKLRVETPQWIVDKYNEHLKTVEKLREKAINGVILTEYERFICNHK